MPPTSPKSLEDALAACDLLLAHVAGQTVADDAGDPWLRAGVERSFANVGEALRRIEKQDPATAAAIPDYRGVIDFRNLLAHDYDSVRHDRVWRFIEVDLPPLRSRLAELLDERQGDG
jgi:uncharacterized protein with HEPN domain